MYFGSQSVAEEQRGNEKKMWLAVRPIVNLQTLLFFFSTLCIQYNCSNTTQQNFKNLLLQYSPFGEIGEREIIHSHTLLELN